MGCVLPAGLGQAPARQAAIKAGLPKSVQATTVNKVCGSGMQTVIMGAEALAAGSIDLVVAGGMESMTNAPYLLKKHRSGARKMCIRDSCHQINDIRPFAHIGGLPDILEHALALGFRFLGDDALQRIDIVIVIVGGVELAALLVDQRFGEIEQVGVGLARGHVAEIAGRLVHFLGIAQHFEHQPLAAGTQPDELLLTAQRKLSQPHLLRSPQRFAQDDIGFLGQIVGGDDIIGLFIIEDVDVARVDELDQFERALALQLDRLDLFFVEQDIVCLLYTSRCV